MIVCFDIGGTSIKYGAAHDPAGQIVFAAHWETPTDAKTLRGPGIARKVLDLIASLRARFDPSGVAISTAGMVQPETGDILYANENIPDYTGINLKRAVEQAFGIPCVVENDVNCAALGEYAYGAGQGADSMFCLTVGTGIGGAVILDGKVWRGSAGSAGEVGYMPINGKPFQDQASTSALVERVRAAKGKALDGRKIFSLAQQGDEVCCREIAAVCDALAQGIACCMCVADPQVIVLGGGVMAQAGYLQPILEKRLQAYANAYMLAHTRLAFARLGNHAGMAGAYYLLKQAER